MAVRWLTSSGNWSSTSVWNDGALLGIPTTGDDVFTNSFTVNMDVNATVNSLNNSARARDIATPAMTANNAPSPYVAAASTIVGTDDAWRGFDRTTATQWSANAATGWLSMDFGSGSNTIIDAYTIFGHSNQTENPRNWTFEGSNDNISWTTLHTVTLPAAIAASSNYSSGNIGNTNSYRYYRINITLNGGSGTRVRIAELELYQPGTVALAAGGSFNFNTAGVSVSCTSTSQGASNLFTITNATGSVSLNVGSNMSAVSAQTTITYSSAGDFNFICPNLIPNNAIASNTLLSKTGAGLLTFNGNAYSIGNPAGGTTRGILSTLGNVIINGNVLGSPSTAISGSSRTLEISGGNLTINGNITPTNVPAASLTVNNCPVFFSGTTLTLNGNTLGGDGLAIVSSGTVNINGTLNGGNSVYANSAITINVTGDVYAGNFASAINCSQSTTTRASVVNLTGNMYNTNGRMAILCDNVFVSNTATTLWRMDTGGGDYKFLYSADTTPNLPPITDVRNLVTYGPALSLTGTMVVPAASDVRENVPVDNTVGTGELTSADIISGINASSDSLAVRLKNILTDKAAGNLISQYKDA